MTLAAQIKSLRGTMVFGPCGGARNYLAHVGDFGDL